jgi:hypothetical protein
MSIDGICDLLIDWRRNVVPLQGILKTADADSEFVADASVMPQARNALEWPDVDRKLFF